MSLTLNLRSQEPYIQVISREKGFGNSSITSLLEDQQGILWAGTQLGLLRFDGLETNVYLPQKANVNSLTNENITDLFEDKEYNLWVSTRNGLTCIDESRKYFTQYFVDSEDTASLPGNGIFQIIPNSDSTFFIVCGRNGLAEFHLPTKKIVRLNPRVESVQEHSVQATPWIFEILITANHYIFARTNTGLWQYDRMENKLVDVQDSITGIDKIRPFPNYCLTREGVIWFTDAQGILYKWLPDHVLQVINDSLVTSAFSSGEFRILDYNQHQLLVTSAGNVLLVDKGSGNVKPFAIREDQKAQINFRWARMCIQTSSGIVVTGTSVGNLYFEDPLRQQFKYHPILSQGHTGDVQPEISGFFEDQVFRKRYISVVQDSFFYVEDLDSGEVHAIRKMRSPNIANKWMLDHQGRLWLCDGTGVHEVNRLDQHLTTYRPSTPAMNIFDMAEIRPGKMIVATLGHGLFWFEPDKNIFEVIPPGKGWVVSQIISLKWDKLHQSVWVGTVNNGVYQYDMARDTFIHHQSHSRNPFAIGGDQIRDITIDSFGYAWFAVEPIGLSRFDYNANPDSSFISFSMGDGLPSSYIAGLTTASDGYIWMTSLNGMASLNPKDFSIKQYGKSDGLPSTKFTRASLSVTADHQIIAGCREGYLLFRPSDLLANQAPPGLVLHDLLVFDQSRMPDKFGKLFSPLTLSYKENYITIRFSVINFTEPERNTVKYILDGFDQQWNVRTGIHEVSYTKVPPGEYTFRMMAANNDGVWNTHETTLVINIRPPFWERTWFYILIGGVVASIVLAFYNFKLNQSIKQNKLIAEKELLKTETEKQLSQLEMKALRAQMNPHFIFNCLNSINRFIVVNDNDAASEYLTKFARLIRQVLDNSRGEKVLLKTEIETLSLYIDMEALRFADKFEYSISIEDGLDTSNYVIQPMLIQPYVENAIWHGLMHRKSKGELRLHFSASDQTLLVTVADNGVGRAMAKTIKDKQMIQRKSHGMKVTAERMSILSRTLNVPVEAIVEDALDSSGQPNGTIVRLTLPLEPLSVLNIYTNEP